MILSYEFILRQNGVLRLHILQPIHGAPAGCHNVLYKGALCQKCIDLKLKMPTRYTTFCFIRAAFCKRTLELLCSCQDCRADVTATVERQFGAPPPSTVAVSTHHANITPQFHQQQPVINININTSPDVTASQADVTTDAANTEFTFTPLAKEFAEWFYKMLNNCSPLLGGDASFSPVHFFPDCSMKHIVVIDGNVEQSDVTGADGVCAKFIDFVTREELLFNPHLDSGGTASKQNAYGLTVVEVCGTVHKHHDVIGTFVQRFGIVKDPSMNYNWRIKHTYLCAQAGNSGQLPAIGGYLSALMPPT